LRLHLPRAAFRAFLVLFCLSFAHALVSCWLLAVGRTWRLQQYSSRARVIRGNPDRTTQKWPQIHSVKEQVPSARDQTLCQQERHHFRVESVCRAPSRLKSVPIRVQLLVRYPFGRFARPSFGRLSIWALLRLLICADATSLQMHLHKAFDDWSLSSVCASQWG
jgi:hypothetical protein